VPTEPSISRDRVFRFGPFELSERQAELRKSGVRIKLQEQPFQVLVELVANSGNLVSREELQQKLWPADTFVDFDVGLNSAIRKLRQALNDDADSPRYIETLAKRGYKFVAPVADSAAAAQTTSKDPPPGTSISLPSDGTKSATSEEIQRKPRRWYWVLAACVLALVSYGALVAWRRANTPPPLAIERQITANPREAPITAAVVSADGKYVAYSDTTGVYVRHIDTGETRPLPLPSALDAIPTSWFPDGTHLLLGSGETLHGFGPPSKDGISSLWKVSLLGGSPQRLMDNASGGTVSPDGSKIAFLRSDATGLAGIWVCDLKAVGAIV
jgi:DNA-binding winged helix-turn-helix (wHTH) protein